MDITYSFIITSLAGLSTLFGTLFIYFKFKNIDKIIVFSLSFASSVMFFISLFDLFPESIHFFYKRFNLFISLNLFFIFFIIGNQLAKIINKNFNSENNLYKIGIISMITIILHNIPEGILTFMTTSINKKIGLNLAIAIAMHNIPEGISIAIPIYYSTKNKLKAFSYTLISALSEPFGALIAYLFLIKYINNIFIASLLSIVCGIMIYISIFELLKEAKNYDKYFLLKVSFIIGFLFVIINLFLNN